MAINRVHSKNVHNLNYANLRNNNKEIKANQKQQSSKKLIFALGALALAGTLIVASKNKNISSKINEIRNIIYSKNIPTEPIANNSNMTEQVAKGAALGIAITKGADIISDKVKREETNTKATEKADEKQLSKSKDDLDEIFFNLKPFDAPSKKEPFPDFISSEIEDLFPDDTEEINNADNEVEGISFNDFKESKGIFYKGIAYMDGAVYSGNLIINNKNKRIVLNYRLGELQKATYSKKNKDGSYSPYQIKEYSKDNNGKKIITISRKRLKDINGQTYEWYKDKICEISDSEIKIRKSSLFDDYLTTYMKKKKDGSWKGFYENREFEYGIGHIVVARDIFTNKILSKSGVKRRMS